MTKGFLISQHPSGVKLSVGIFPSVKMLGNTELVLDNLCEKKNNFIYN